MVLDPDAPPLLSSDPDYSSSSEHSCDGPRGMVTSHRELSNNEGPPSFVPIIPSLNKKPVRDAPRSDGDHFKCNTFAELQERMDCIYGSTEGKAIRAAAIGAQNGTLNSTEPTSPHKSARKSSHESLESTTTVCINNPDQEHSRFSFAVSFMDASSSTNEEKLSAALCQSCGMKPTATYSQDSELVLQEKLHLKGGVPKLLASPSSPRTSRAAAEPEQVVSWTPPAGMSQQALGSLLTERVRSRCLVEVGSLQPTVLENCSDSFLRTTVTFQQPVDLNGEDELVFSVVEELPCGLTADNSCPSNLLSFNTDCSLQASSSSSQPVSIIGSINDEYDVYTAKQGAVGTAADDCADHQEILFSQYGHMHSVVSPAKSEGSPVLTNRDNNIVTENPSMPTSQRLFLKQHGVMSSLHNSSCYSELDRSHTSSNNPADTKCPSQSHSLNTSGSAQIPPPAAHPTDPQKTKLTSSATVSCYRQEGSDPREVEFLSASKPPRHGMSVSSKRPSVSQPPKASSSSQRVVDSCERTGSWRRYTLIKLPRLSQGAEKLGTVSSQQTGSKWGPVGTLVKGTLKFSSIGKMSNGQKSIMSSKSGNFCPPLAPFVTQSIQGPTTTTQNQSAFKTSHNTGRSTVSEEEFNIRIQADSFTHRISSVKTERSSARTSSSLKSRRVKAEPYRNYGSWLSLKRCDSQMLSGTRPELLRENHDTTLRGNIRSAPRHKAPSSTVVSRSQHSPGDFATTVKVLGQVKGHSSRVPTSDESKVKTLSTCSTKSQSSSLKPVDNVTGQNPSLLSAGQSLVRLGTGAKMGRGRAANSQVSELAAVSQREQLSRAPGVTGNDATESRKCSVSRSPINTLLPSPYSKITAPRRPQRYSSDNSSILSGEQLPAMGRTALFYHSGGSSGYESIIRDGETTGSTSSAHDSMSESGESSSMKSRVSKSPNKRGNGEWAWNIISSKIIRQESRNHEANLN